MKLAIIMSGMLRNFEHTFFSTKKFILEDKFFEKKDIFFYGYSDNFELDESIKKFEKLYKPKKFKIEKWNENIKHSIEMKTASNKWPKFQTASSVTNIMSSWRCRYLANEFKIAFEKVNNFKYDLVYQLRTDFFCFNYIDHKLAIKATQEKNSIYIPKDWDHKDADPIAVGDIMAYGSSKAMNNYFSLYKNAKRYWIKGIKGHPETILGYHFKDKKINRKYCERNVAREYPYTIPTYDYLWSKWPIDQVKKDLRINDAFLSNERKKYNMNNKFLKFINNLRQSILIKIILQYYKKIFKFKINKLVNKFNLKLK